MTESSSPENTSAGLKAVYDALVQAQDCIRGETPEDVTDAEAREDTINKVRDAMREVEGLLDHAQSLPHPCKHQPEAASVTSETLAQFLHENQPIMLGGRSQPLSVYQEFSRLILSEFNIRQKSALTSPERRCEKCGEPTKSEEAWVDGKIWCHPCADGIQPQRMPDRETLARTAYAADPDLQVWRSTGEPNFTWEEIKNFPNAEDHCLPFYNIADAIIAIIAITRRAQAKPLSELEGEAWERGYQHGRAEAAKERNRPMRKKTTLPEVRALFEELGRDMRQCQADGTLELVIAAAEKTGSMTREQILAFIDACELMADKLPRR